jgi:hypothetical protein
VIKLDTESTEPDVLAGARRCIAEHRPWILCEVLAGRTEARLTEVMAPFGYHWYHVTDKIPWTRAQTIVGDQTHRHLMWLFAPQPAGERFWAAVRSYQAALARCTAPPGAATRGVPQAGGA